MKIYRLGEIPQEFYPHVGGKARGLDFLKRNGFNVPDGFVISEPSEIDIDCVLKRFDELNCERVSVRSSATDEDGAEFSSAGQYLTCLNVTRGGLKKAIDDCVSSIGSSRASAYQNMSGSVKAEMNVVVQAMADAKFAGVAFTVNPMDSSAVLIEAVEGMGEELVSGAKSAFSYSVPRDKFVCPEPCEIGAELLERIYTDVKKIAELFGAESDIEWVADERGDLYFLQLRPITATSDGGDDFDSKNPLDNHLLTTRNIGEMLPGAVTPLSISTSVLAIDYGIRNMLYKVGAIKSVNAKPDYNNALAIDRHLFMDMTALHYMSKRVAAASSPAMNLSIMGEMRTDNPKVEGKNAFFLVKLINAVKFGKYIFSSKKAKAKLVELFDNLEIADKPTALEQYEEITAKLPAINEALCNHYVCSSYSGAMNSGLYMTLAKNFPSVAEYQAFMSNILSDIDGIESADILASLRLLADELVAVCPNAEDLSDDDLLAFVSNPENASVNTLFNDFIVRHGHRSIKEAEMRSKAWKNDKKAVIANLRTVMLNRDGAEKQKFDIDEFIKSYKGKGKGALKFLAPRARQAVVDREFSKSYIIKVIDKFKDAYARLAGLMVESGHLADADSIYFLSHDEIGRLLGGKRELKRVALTRRAEFGKYEELSFDDVCIGRPKPINTAESSGDGKLAGIPVCRGIVYGKARVVRSSSDAQKLCKGEIMVAPFTDIGWSPYYSLVGGLITEVGSALSHGAVVAREYCLPTIVNVKNATKLIKDGDYLKLNASVGTVSVISEEDYLKNI